ncbi:18264_t:CDS:2, partial [Cetraspora pellucida]
VLSSTISKEETETEKYPGAYVFPPVKGLENRHSVTGLDFASLYSSLIMTYNLSPDKIILSRENAKQSGKKLHEISFKFIGQDIFAWSIQHNNISEEKGLYVNILEYLSGKRNEMKKRLAPLKEKKDDIGLVIGLMDKGLSLPEAIKQVLAKVKKKKCTSLNKNLYYFINKEEHEFKVEYDSVCFDYSCLDTKQYAFKVYMNTFYSMAGDSKFPFFLRELAGSVTSAGQRNIKLVTEFIKSKRFEIKYGNTNSLYLTCSEECFQECDETYDKEVLKKTINDISQINLDELIQTSAWKPDKDNKSSLMPESYLYQISEPGEHFEYIVVENNSSQKVEDKMEYPEVVRQLGKKIDINYYLKSVAGLCARFINYDDRFQPSSEFIEKSKNGKDLDEDDVSNMKDALVQKSAEKWIKEYIKDLCDRLKKDEAIISYL